MVVEVGFEIGQCRSDAAAAAHGDLVGGDGRDGPMSGEERRQLLCGGRQQLDGLEPRLEPLRQRSSCRLLVPRSARPGGSRSR